MIMIGKRSINIITPSIWANYPRTNWTLYGSPYLLVTGSTTCNSVITTRGGG